VNRIAGEVVKIGPLLARAAATTDGLVTPLAGGALAAAGYDRTFREVRERGRWTPLPASVPSWQEIELDERSGTIRIPAGARLDLGSTAKALAADDAAAEIAKATGGGALVSLGGDIAVSGEPPGDGWIVLLADDHMAPLTEPGPTVALTEGGLATSSTAVRRWATDDGEAHHVIDPRTARPASSCWRTVTAAAASCVEANAAALACILLDAEAPKWIRAHGLHARLVSEIGVVHRVGSWPVEVDSP
jgi:thiamine biosynthesis lipoprotein